MTSLYLIPVLATIVIALSRVWAVRSTRIEV